MYAGEVVEEGATEDVLADPRHPYTWALLNAVPRIDQPRAEDRRLITIEGAPPDPLDLPPGCRFAPRCPFSDRELRRSTRRWSRWRRAGRRAAG